MKKLLLATALLTAFPAFAVEFEAALGNVEHNKSNDGIWWQRGPAEDGFHDNFNLNPVGYSLGLTDKLSPSVRWHVGYTNLGEVHSVSTDTPSDAEYNVHGAGGGCVGPCPGLSTIVGSGFVDGVHFTLAPEIRRGDWTFFVEGGVWAYTAHFQIDVVNASGGFATKSHSPLAQLGPVFGFGASYKKTDISFKWYKTDADGDEWIANYQGYAVFASIRQRF